MSRIIISSGNLLGVINELGQVLIEPCYEEMRSFSNGFAAACMGDKWGYIDRQGNQIIDFLYEEAKDFSEQGIAAVKLNKEPGSWVLINNKGELIQMQNDYGYYYIGDFNSYGFAIVKCYSYYYIMDKNGNHINDEAYYSLEYLENQEVFIADKVGKLCLIDDKGKVEINPDDEYHMIYYPNKGLCQVEKDDKMGYINEDGKLVIPLKYKMAYAFADNGLAYVEYGTGKGGYINGKGEFLIKPIFESGTVFEYGKAAVSIGGKYIFIDESGRKSIDQIFNYASGFSKCGLAKVEFTDGRLGFIKADGDLAFMLEEGWDASEFIANKNTTQLKIGNKVGLIDNYGQVILEPSYEAIEISTANIHSFSKDGLWGYIDDYGNVVIENTYDKANEFTENNLALVEYLDPIKDEMIKTYINDRNERVDYSQVEEFWSFITDKYSEIEGYYQGLALATKKEETKILNAYGQEIKCENILIN